MSEEVRIVVPGKLEYIQMVKLAVGSLASATGFDYEMVEDVKMAVAEACKCITCHNRAFWSKDYELVATMDEELFRVTITDNHTSQHDVPKEQCICVDCPKEGDLSLSIIKSLMDEVSVENDAEDGCKVISMTKRRTDNAK